MNRARILILLFAIGCAAVAALLARGMLSQQPASSPTVQAPPATTVSVLVAAKDLAVGEALNPLSFEWREWPRDNVASFMITREARPTAIEDFDGGRARAQFYLGEPVAERKIVTLKDGGLMSSLLPRGLRGVAIKVSDRSAASGFILPNDRVDVIATVRARLQGGSSGDREVVFTRTIVTNARVLAINRNISPDADPPSADQIQTAVLELDPEQAEIVALTEAQGELSLALRSIQEMAGSPESQRPELARATTEDSESLTIFTPRSQRDYSCEGNCFPTARGLNTPFPLTFRDRLQEKSTPR